MKREYQENLEKTRQKLCSLSEKAAESQFMQEVRVQIDGAIRAVDQFESGIEVVVCIGMLKAGKSTLVNLLTRSPMASPIGFGRDTTLRPAIIRMAEKGNPARIVIYERQEGASVTEQMRLVMDHLRGLTGKTYPEHLIRYLPLTDASVLTKVLCSEPGTSRELPQEPVMVVVETEYSKHCELLRDRRRMLLDMPGCDSPTARVSLTDDYKEIGKECDMALIVQSSVAPLNEKAAKLLSELLGSRSSSTIRIIQNRMEAKPWLKQSVIDEENASQMKNACTCFSVLSGNQSLNPQSVNLGMAYAAMFEANHHLRFPVVMPSGKYDDRKELLQESGFPGMEESFRDSLKDARRDHCADALRYALAEVQRVIGTTGVAIHEKIAQYRSEREKLAQLGAQAENEFHIPSMPRNVRFEPVTGSGLPNFEDICNNTARDWQDGILYRSEVKCKLVNECMQACADACRDAMLDFLSQELSLSHLRVSIDGEQMQMLESYCRHKLIDDNLREACKRMDGHHLLSHFRVDQLPMRQGEIAACRIPVSDAKSRYGRSGRRCRFTPMNEVAESGLIWDTPAKHPAARLNEEGFRPIIVDIVKFYNEELCELVNAYAPFDSIDSVLYTTYDDALVPFHQAFKEKINAINDQIKHAEKQMKELSELSEKIAKLQQRHENAH